MKKTMILLVAMTVLMISFTHITNSSASSTIPLPDDLKVIPPNPSLPENIKALSGKWAGEWIWRGGSLQTILVVEEILSETKATIVYAAANGPWNRFECEIWTKGKKTGIFFKGPDSGRKFEFTLKDNGSLTGAAAFSGPRGDNTSYIVMKPF